MKSNYRHQKKLKEQARRARQAEKLLRRKSAKAADGTPPADEPPAGEPAAQAKPAT